MYRGAEVAQVQTCKGVAEEVQMQRCKGGAERCREVQSSCRGAELMQRCRAEELQSCTGAHMEVCRAAKVPIWRF